MAEQSTVEIQYYVVDGVPIRRSGPYATPSKAVATLERQLIEKDRRQEAMKRWRR
jgi:hypothetical protein